MRRDDPSPDARFTEIASILARGLLRLKSSRNLASESPPNKPQQNQDSANKPLEFSAKKRRHVPAG